MVSKAKKYKGAKKHKKDEPTCGLRESAEVGFLFVALLLAFIGPSLVPVTIADESVDFDTEDDFEKPLPMFVSTDETSEKTGQTSCGNEYCSEKSKRYILYDLNPGEGFNLKRDIYIRVAPLMDSLNKDDQEKRKWILVLPPWGKLPHWRNTDPGTLLPWKTFFKMDKIKEYIPVIEFQEYLDEVGLDNPIDFVYQLQHFPFEISTKDWRDKIEISVCEDPLRFKLDPSKGLYIGNFWLHTLSAKKVQCMALRGQASTLKKFLLNSETKTVMFDRSEVILWDHYGGEDWWRARMSIQFADNLNKAAEKYLNLNNLVSSASNKNLIYDDSEIKLAHESGDEYLGVHLRRRDFLLGRKESLPSLDGAAKQIAKICKERSLRVVFLATDADQKEINELESKLKEYAPKIQVKRFICEPQYYLDGECAIIDQIICSHSNYFIGTEDSTFTFRIFEEREILGFEPNQTYHYLCRETADSHVKDPSSKKGPCKKPTQWRIPSRLTNTVQQK